MAVRASFENSNEATSESISKIPDAENSSVRWAFLPASRMLTVWSHWADQSVTAADNIKVVYGSIVVQSYLMQTRELGMFMT